MHIAYSPTVYGLSRLLAVYFWLVVGFPWVRDLVNSHRNLFYAVFSMIITVESVPMIITIDCVPAYCWSLLNPAQTIFCLFLRAPSSLVHALPMFLSTCSAMNFVFVCSSCSEFFCVFILSSHSEHWVHVESHTNGFLCGIFS